MSARTISLLETGRRDAPRLASARLLAQALSLRDDDRAALLDATTRRVVGFEGEHQRVKPANAGVAPHYNGSFLPRDVPDFVGRAGELDRLVEYAPAASEGVAAVTTIDGMAGVGKSAFAVHAAHMLAEHYPDGQFFYDLHGFSPNRDPVDAATALEALLRMAGLPDGQIPASLDGRSAAWRSMLAGRRILVLLDNVVSPSQILPLLPGTPGSHVIITSRRRLAAVDGATPISLGPLRSAEALALFAAVAGHDRVAGQLDGVAEIVRLFGYLPLAIRIAAARLLHRPTWTVTGLAERMRDGGYRLSELDSEGDRGMVAALTLSGRLLNADQLRLFTLLGLYPGVDFDVHSIAALADIAPRRSEVLLDGLVGDHLLMEPVAGRYVLHELVRDYARTLAMQTESPESRAAAVARLLEHQVSTACAAVELIMPELCGAQAGKPGTRRTTVELRDKNSATSWLDTEYPNLVASANHSGRTGRAKTLASILERLISVTAETTVRCRATRSRGYQGLMPAAAHHR
ncbi:hypothetical protein AOZ06_39665 [Kibdelosporangium phytohabitans]|uniref:Uncharacterized protein n=1 Tax=Kibdelosporangium phytohabitans TaxID=860235 RepID=A0A0N9IAP2_9PSEU|nr:hypothetical protein AOZ06_39665 [Kibdelosporangium phytohabitans]